MNAFLNYCIEANMVLLLFTIIYFILFEKETQFTFRRWYLLITIVASLVFPLIEFETAQPVIPSISSVVPPSYLPEVNGAEVQQPNTTPLVNYWDVAMGIYSVVISILLLSFCVRIGRLLRYIKSSSFVQEGKFRIAVSNADHPTFSFFHYIFIGRADQLDQSEKDQIINHEKLHARRVHSLDMLISESLKIIFWFNPLVYIIKNQLVSIHEYEADQQAVSDQDADVYCDLLGRASLASAGLSLANHFHNSLTLKRIVMINTKKTKMKRWKYAVLIPVFAGGLILVSCQEQVISEIKEIAKSSSMTLEIPSEVAAKIAQLKKANPGQEYVVMEMNEQGAQKLNDIAKSAKLDPNEIKSISRVNTTKESDGAGRTYVIIAKGSQTTLLSELTKTNGDIYTVADESAAPTDKAALAKYIQKNIKYPQVARKNGTQGKVLVEFVVEKDGGISNARIFEGISPECDAEAVRIVNGIVNGSSRWTPGKLNGEIIRQKMILPIEFILDGAPKPILSASLNETPAQKLDVVSIVGYAPLPVPQPALPESPALQQEDKIYEAVESPPAFPGGMTALREFIDKELKYPESARGKNAEGKVFASFVVEKDGTVTHVALVKGIGYGLDEEALRVVASMPKWTPGKQEEQIVRVRYIIPIAFSKQ